MHGLKWPNINRTLLEGVELGKLVLERHYGLALQLRALLAEVLALHT